MLNTIDELKEGLRSIADDAAVAAIHHRLATDLSDASPNYLREMNEARAFWSLTMYAHLSEVRTRLCRLYDQHRSSLSLRNWLAAANLNTAACQLVNPIRFQAEVEKTDPLVKKLYALRNKVVAHNDSNISMNRRALEQAFGLAFEESDLLVKRSITIVNTCGQALMGETWSPQIVGQDDFLTVLKAIRFHNAAIEAEVQSEINARLGEV